MTRHAAELLLVAWTASMLMVGSTNAASFASAVIDYVPGTVLAPDEIAAGAEPRFPDPTAALGSPDDISGEHLGFPNVLSPFSPAFEADEVVEIGPGGQLTLRLSHLIEIGDGHDLGIFSNAGLQGDFDPATFALLGATDPAMTFGSEAAVIEVSRDGSSWTPLEDGEPILIDMPSNFYRNAGVFDSSAPPNPQLADFGLPIPPDISLFSGADEAGILNTLGDSAGGYWLDLSPTGLELVGFIRFRVPASLLPSEPFGSADLDEVVFELDAVAIANDKLGLRIPEPTTAWMTLLFCWLVPWRWLARLLGHPRPMI